MLSFGSFQSVPCTISPGPSQERVSGDGWRRVMLFRQWISYRWAEEAEPVIDAAPPGEPWSWSLWRGGKEGDEGRKERLKGEEFKKKERGSLASSLETVLRWLPQKWLWVAVLWFIKTIYWWEWSCRQHVVKYSKIKQRSRYHWTRRGSLLSHVFASFSLFSLTFLFVPVCVSKGRKTRGLFPYRNSLWFMFPLLWSASCAQPRDKPFQVV